MDYRIDGLDVITNKKGVEESKELQLHELKIAENIMRSCLDVSVSYLRKQ